MMARGSPAVAPLDACLSIAKHLPIPDNVGERDRDLLWATITRRVTGRSMGAIGDEYGLTAGKVRASAIGTMRRMGIQGLTWDDPAYRHASAETTSGRLESPGLSSRERSGPYDGRLR